MPKTNILILCIFKSKFVVHTLFYWKAIIQINSLVQGLNHPIMKTIYLILIAILSIQTSCSTDNNDVDIQKKIIGKWQVIEWYASQGGPGSWQTIEDGFYYQFNENGTVESDIYNCIGNYSIQEDMEYNLFMSFICDSGQSKESLKMVFAGNYLFLWGDCDEACGGKFKKIQNE
jgi:hypothetical protein